MAMAYKEIGEKQNAMECLQVCLAIRKKYFVESDEAVLSILNIIKDNE
jgi:hypothetical protein